jgi:HlyD family secretion protein
MKKISEKKVISIIIFVTVLLLGVIGYIALSGKKPTVDYAYAAAQKGTLTNVIKTTGNVKAAQELSLSFERSAKVKSVNVKVGDSVTAGQTLIELDGSDVSADATQAAASVSVAQSQLQQLEAGLDLQRIKKTEMLKGARPEEVQLAQTKRDTAAQSLEDAKASYDNATTKATADRMVLVNSIGDMLQSASATADDVLSRQTLGMFVNDGTQNTDPKLAINAALDSSVKYRAQDQRRIASIAANTLKALQTQLVANNSNGDQIAGQAADQLGIVRDYLNSLNDALNASVTSTDLPQSKVDGFKASVTASLGSVNAAITSLNAYRKSVVSMDAANTSVIKAAQSKVDDAQNALTLADNSLTLEKAGATAEQLASQDAAIAQAQAAVSMQKGQIVSVSAAAQKAADQLAKTVVKAPVDGIITKLDLDAGESVVAGTPAVGEMSNSKFQIEGFVPETGVFSIKVGSEAEVTLDSIGSGKTYAAKVVIIDPAATVTNGVSTYKVTLELEGEDETVKSGLTANVRILAEEEKDVLIIPETSVIKSGDERFVIIKGSGEKRKITLGNIVQDGKVGVTSGLSEGEQVADFAGNNK